ncbi:hypothetical protein Pelo_10185 [Pelomyxa schiedti]|nr:hypothetical protein Pelo_10185 [Pelomyxa schiedti]
MAATATGFSVVDRCMALVTLRDILGPHFTTHKTVLLQQAFNASVPPLSAAAMLRQLYDIRFLDNNDLSNWTTYLFVKGCAPAPPGGIDPSLLDRCRSLVYLQPVLGASFTSHKTALLQAAFAVQMAPTLAASVVKQLFDLKLLDQNELNQWTAAVLVGSPLPIHSPQRF